MCVCVLFLQRGSNLQSDHIAFQGEYNNTAIAGKTQHNAQSSVAWKERFHLLLLEDKTFPCTTRFATFNIFAHRSAKADPF